MKENYNPVEMHGSWSVVAASLVVPLAAAALVLALQTHVIAVVTAGGVLVASRTRRLSGRWQRRGKSRRARRVCVPATEICVEV